MPFESRKYIASQWPSPYFFIVSCIFIATRVTSHSTWGGWKTVFLFFSFFFMDVAVATLTTISSTFARSHSVAIASHFNPSSSRTDLGQFGISVWLCLAVVVS